MGSLSPQITAALIAWGELMPKTSVLFYDPLPDEPDVTSLAAATRAMLTRTPEQGTTITVHEFTAPRERHRLGFSQPAAGTAEIDPTAVDLVLVPGLAFDRNGVRLGRGGGHYDRLLAGLRPDARVVGVCPAEVVVDALPREAHDRPMTHLATEQGVYAVSDRGPGDIARSWIAADPDPITRAELQALVDSGDTAALGARLVPLEFGTAGIRGAVGAGPGRMNRAVVIRTTRGLADWLTAKGRGGGTVVVGYDGRVDSRRFAEDAVAVLSGAGSRRAASMA
jgi:5,10-methenyltetrahydrofolate synthetase